MTAAEQEKKKKVWKWNREADDSGGGYMWSVVREFLFSKKRSTAHEDFEQGVTQGMPE